MKIYAIGYENIDGTLHFFMYTCKFLSERTPIDAEWYEELKSTFTLAHKDNKALSGMYFTPEL